jgi:hypothetical protein
MKAAAIKGIRFETAEVALDKGEQLLKQVYG